MLKILATTLLALALVACADDSSKKKTNGNIDQKPDQTLKPISDTTICRSGTPVSSIQGRWMLQFRSQDLDMLVNLSFQGSFFSMSSACRPIGGSSSVVARVSSPIKDIGGAFEVLQDDSDVQKGNVDGLDISCSIALKKSQVFSYRFNGSCLDLTADNQTLTFLPSKY